MSANRRLTFRTALLLTCTLAACGHSSPSSSSGTSTRSASAIVGTTHIIDGVTTVDHRADAADRAPRFTIDTVPIAMMGGAGVDPAYDLTYAYPPVMLTDGRYTVTVAIGGGHLMLFGSSGKPLRTYGRPGQGPGDFGRPGRPIQVAGDTLLIFDDGNARVNWFAPDHGLVRAAPLATKQVGSCLSQVGRLPGQRVVSWSTCLRENPADTVRRPRIRVTVSDLQLDHLRLIDSVPGWEMAHITSHYHGRDRQEVVMVRLGQKPSVAVIDTLIAVADGANGYAIVLRNAEGRVVSRIRVPVRRRAVTPAMRDAQVKLEMSRLPANGQGLSDPVEVMRQVRENPFADSLPPYEPIQSTPGKLLWVIDALAPSDTAWDATAFRGDGAIVGRLHVSGRGTPMVLGDDRVIVRSVDDDGLVSLRVYRLIKP